jgi:hypothetical protein
MGLCLVEAVLESGGDVICIDLQAQPPAEEWGQYFVIVDPSNLLSRLIIPLPTIQNHLFGDKWSGQ